ncbi:Zinc finger protein 385D [Merluccius polli]|uniref:Zinc finger protein 385D n=1 Tax=Merluccius polli TaxID=89951 RepID=A0AA47N744_MERPO|nr:Zinc finger protein 385D [Merluccius polli]
MRRPAECADGPARGHGIYSRRLARFALSPCGASKFQRCVAATNSRRNRVPWRACFHAVPENKSVLKVILAAAAVAATCLDSLSAGLTTRGGSSSSQALAHYKGTKHAKKLKAHGAPKTRLKGSAVAKETAKQENAKGINMSQSPNDADRKDGVPGAAPLPLSPVLRLAPPLAMLTALTKPTFTPALLAAEAPPPMGTDPETTSVGGDGGGGGGGGEEEEGASKPGSPATMETDAAATPEDGEGGGGGGGEGEGEAGGETEEEKAKRLLYCSLCKVAVNSASQLEAHNSGEKELGGVEEGGRWGWRRLGDGGGTKHKTMLEARTGVGSIKSYPRPAVKGKPAAAAAAAPARSTTGLQNKTFHCETCDVHVNSETQLKQHISSRRHKDRAAGKPAKPKYSPYSKPAKGATKTPVKLPVGKDLMPTHLAVVAAAAAAAMGNTFSLRPAGHAHHLAAGHAHHLTTGHAHHLTTGHPPHHLPTCHAPRPALFQSQSLSAALLRPAPGPVRTSHPQVLFAPY